jgi:putative ABC transport system substrate-binding protein
MDRRAFLGALVGGVLAPPLLATAQQAGRIFRIGLITSGVPLPPPPGHSPNSGFWLYERLQELGWVYGRQLVGEQRAYGDRTDRVPDLAAELIQADVDVFVVEGGTEAELIQRVTRTIPIVTLRAGDLVAMGLAASLARPGGNVTGVQTLQSELAAKDLSLLKEVVPRLSRSGILVPAPFSSPFATALLREATSAGKALGIDLQIVRLQSPDELEKAFSDFRAERAQGVLVVRSQYLSTHSKTVADIALKHHLPTVSDSPSMPRNGGLISYGFDPRGTVRSAAEIVDSILRGGRASEIPIRQSTTFQLVINLKTAKFLGLRITPSVLQRADQVIE